MDSSPAQVFGEVANGEQYYGEFAGVFVDGGS